MIAHFDINNCYCSIEAVFNPKLRGKATVVLSNNDGAVVARSAEAKALGIQMSEPWHLVEERFRGRVIPLSSNYTLYGDMSRRVMDIARTFAERFEQYSIDEAFVFQSPGCDIDRLGAELRATIRKQTGLSVSVGIAPTKVLAKAANRVSKKNPSLGGVFRWPGGAEGEAILRAMNPSDVWGIAGRLEARLQPYGIENAFALSQMPDELARRVLTVTGLRIVLELRGFSCIEIEEVAPAKKSIVCSRSFGAEVDTVEGLIEAGAKYAERASEKLRAGKLATERMHFFASTNPFKPELPQHHDCIAYTFDTATNLAFDLVAAATSCARAIFRPGVRYKKAGVMLFGLGPENVTQLAFTGMPRPDFERRRRLMEAVDKVKRDFGSESVRCGSVAATPKWKARARRLSPRYTTRIDELPIAFA